MRFERLLEEVQKAEQRVEVRRLLAGSNWRALKARWREAWTPGRILAVGLAGGFLFARARPLRAIGAVSTTRWIQLATSLSGLFASLKAAQAAESAETAATDAGDAAQEATDTVEAVTGAAPGDAAGAGATGDAGQRRSVSDARRRADPSWDAEPRPAEAATELSER